MHLCDDGVECLAEALKAGALPRLRELDIHYVNMGERGFNALSRALVEHGACPRLARLRLSYYLVHSTPDTSKFLAAKLERELDETRGKSKVKIIWD